MTFGDLTRVLERYLAARYLVEVAKQGNSEVITIDPYYFIAYPATCLLMFVLGRAFVFFVNNNLPFPDHQPRPMFEEITWGIAACGFIQYFSGAIYHGTLFYEVYAVLWLLNSAGLFLVALWPGGVWSAYSGKRKPPSAEDRPKIPKPKKSSDIVVASNGKALEDFYTGLHQLAGAASDTRVIMTNGGALYTVIQNAYKNGDSE